MPSARFLVLGLLLIGSFLGSCMRTPESSVSAEQAPSTAELMAPDSASAQQAPPPQLAPATAR